MTDTRSTPESDADRIYVPGLLRCKKCGFELSKRTLNMAVGTITANNDPDTCPNDGSPMWRVSEREYREQLFNDLLATRNDTLDFAARVCRDLIEKMNKRGRLQARAILEDCAKEIEGRKTERPIAQSEWLVWSNEHCAWWGPDRAGYYRNLSSAGRYTLAEARSVSRVRSWVDGVPPETLIHEKDVKHG